jgi:hypothetical protein
MLVVLCCFHVEVHALTKQSFTEVATSLHGGGHVSRINNVWLECAALEV